MPNEEPPLLHPKPARRAGLLTCLSRFLRLVLILTILGAAAAVSHHWLTNRPRAERRPPERRATLVEVEPVQFITHRVVVKGMGAVTPADKIQLSARIGGQVVHVSPQFIPGGHFNQHQEILRID
ncbi:MAG TPA: hypothetical protein ENN80_07885, partial [Candidatus Hydrogenedentes bacterium]|nr:hypothetical protein [Candidatus Hydrogenedentota bacterium]